MEIHNPANQSLDPTVKTPVDLVKVYVHGGSGLTLDWTERTKKQSRNREHRSFLRCKRIDAIFLILDCFPESDPKEQSEKKRK